MKEEKKRIITLSPVTKRFPKGFHFKTEITELCCELLENVQVGRFLPSTNQQDTIPSFHPMAKIRPLGCHAITEASQGCDIGAVLSNVPSLLINTICPISRPRSSQALHANAAKGSTLLHANCWTNTSLSSRGPLSLKRTSLGQKNDPETRSFPWKWTILVSCFEKRKGRKGGK